MNNRSVEQLERQVAELQERLLQSEQDSAELAGRALEEIDQLRAANSCMGRNLGETGPFCKGCEAKRRWFAFYAGVWCFSYWYGFGWEGHPPTLARLLVFLLAGVPYLVVIGQWHLRLFKRDNHWVSWDDNDRYRRCRDRWNAFVGGFEWR